MSYPGSRTTPSAAAVQPGFATQDQPPAAVFSIAPAEPTTEAKDFSQGIARLTFSSGAKQARVGFDSSDVSSGTDAAGSGESAAVKNALHPVVSKDVAAITALPETPKKEPALTHSASTPSLPRTASRLVREIWRSCRKI